MINFRVIALREENRRLTDVITRQALNEQSLEGNNEIVKYYTGLTSIATLMALFSSIFPSLSVVYHSFNVF